MQICRDIYRWHREDTGVAISHATLATRTNASRSTVARALAELERHRIISRERQTTQSGHYAASRIRITIPEKRAHHAAPFSPHPDHP